MPGDDLFKRYLEIGASVLSMSRERAEAIVKDLVASGEVAKGQATKAADRLVERGRSGSEEITELVRREIRQQVTGLGLATRDDIARLESQIEQMRVAAAVGPAPTRASAGSRPGKAKAPAEPAEPAEPAATGVPTATRSRTRKAAAGTMKSAGISRSAPASRPGATSSSEPGAAPPAGGADPSKG